MKKVLIGIYLIGCIMMSGNLFGAINRLVRVEASSGEYASQVVFEFMHPLYYEKEVDGANDEKVILYFPGMSLSDFDELAVLGKIRTLSMVKNVSVTVQKNPVPRVVVAITFTKDSVILRVTKMEEPNLLVLDIFDKDVLEAIRKKVTTTLYACNGSSLPCMSAAKKKRVLQPRKAHIVIDAGHGGKDNGASSFGLKEKNFTLDIARRTYTALKKEGYRVFLTRTSDSYLSVVDRVQLARQLKADLFVSVHVNAVAGLQHVSGVETYFCDGSPYFTKKNRRKSFLFVHDAYDKQLAKVADEVLYRRITQSKGLSDFIHEGILSQLEKKGISAVNRGVKQASFGVLLRNEAPASLVEVGFLTNKQEAKRLTKPTYRDWLSQGICRGIKQFLHIQSLAHQQV